MEGSRWRAPTSARHHRPIKRTGMSTTTYKDQETSTTHQTKAWYPDLSVIMRPKNIYDSIPKAHQEGGPGGRPRHINVRSDTLNFKDSTSSAFGPDEFDPDAADSDEEELIGHDAPCSDNGNNVCPLCKQRRGRPQQHDAQVHLVSRHGEWVIET